MPLSPAFEALPRLLAIARGDEPADLLLSGARIVNVFSGEIEENDVAIAAGWIAGVGSGYRAHEEVNLAGAYIAPGLIDAHVHIESSLCLPAAFATAVLPRGVTTVVADPHEIANVAGIDGIRFMHEACRGLPLRVVLMAPSCVPATGLATNGASLGAGALTALLREGIVHGLAEVMNFPGVIAGDEAVLAKLRGFAGRPRDGHAPAITGHGLNAYLLGGIGSDHECDSAEEALEKLARGAYILIREATNAHNLHELLSMVTLSNSRRICFCTDDRQPADLLAQGGIDYMLREAIRSGVDPIEAFRMATLNTSEWFGLHDRGAVAPGRLADLIVFDDLSIPVPRRVYSGGRLVAEAGAMVAPISSSSPRLGRSAASPRIDWSNLSLSIPARTRRVRVIGTVPDQLVTEERLLDMKVDGGLAVTDVERDILKMAVIERHRGTGSVGLGFIQGFGLRDGAIAGTVAHDHHNLVVIGTDDDSMLAAARAAATGGLAVAQRGRVLHTLPLPVAGLMSDLPIERVRAEYDRLLDAARGLGSRLHDPFMAMSFMALEVIPKLKLTDRGLVDVEQFRLVDLFV